MGLPQTSRCHGYVDNPGKTGAKFEENKMCGAIPKTALPAKRCETALPTESDGDVEFLVGTDQVCRVPGCRRVLVAANPEFCRMLAGRIARDEPIRVPDIPWRGFANLVGYLSQKQVKLLTVKTALATLHAALRFLCHGLHQLCMQHLVDNLDTTCVLDVFFHMYPYCEYFGCATDTDLESYESAPYAPSGDASPLTPEEEGVLRAVVTNYKTLRRRCLQFCDEHADEVLSLEQLEELPRNALLQLIVRDSFAASSEALVFGAVQRWALCRCQCVHRPLCTADLREEAGALVYAVRYLLMSAHDFINGPVRSGLLSEEAVVFFLERIRQPSALPADAPPKYLQDLLDKMCTPRAGTAGCLRSKKAAKKEKKQKVLLAFLGAMAWFFD